MTILPLYRAIKLSGIWIAVTLAGLCACSGGGIKKFEHDSSTVAVVGKYAVSKADLQEYLDENRAPAEDADVLKSRLWDRLEEELLILNDASPDGGAPPIVSLSEAGPIPTRRQTIELALQKQVYSKVSVTDEDVQRYYKEHPEEFSKGNGYLIRQLLLPSLAAAEDSLKLLAQKHSFEDVAKLYSVSPDRGGPVYFEEGELPDYLRDILRSLTPGHPSKPLNVGSDTFQIVQVEKKMGSYQIPFDEVSMNVRLKLTDAAGEKLYGDYMATLRKRLEVRIFPKKFPFSYQKEARQ